MESSSAETPDQPQVVFRAGKKRKNYRQRAEETAPETDEPKIETDESSAPPPKGDAQPVNDDDSKLQAEGLSMAEVIRLRNARKPKLKGVEFRPESAPKAAAPNPEQSLVTKDVAPSDDSVIAGISRRFASQTGIVGELVNKHMEEYIESELAKRKNAAETPAQLSTNPGGFIQQAAGLSAASAAAGKRDADQPTMHGKLQEIDLGDEARMRNVAMTDKARRRMEGESVEDEEGGSSRKRVRLGKDGKPWRSRKRRDSDALKREQLVEQILRENKLDIYDNPVQPEPSAEPGNDLAADEKIAEEFRREFMEAMSQRKQRKKPAPAPPKPGAKVEEVLKGPKLGGSRNSRAAMRDLLLKQEQQKKK